jgi:hypothetical protein
MPDAGVAGELLGVLGLEYVVHQPLPLVQVEGVAVKRCNAGGILPPVLEGGEADNHIAYYPLGAMKTYDATHN